METLYVVESGVVGFLGRTPFLDASSSRRQDEDSRPLLPPPAVASWLHSHQQGPLNHSEYRYAISSWPRVSSGPRSAL